MRPLFGGWRVVGEVRLFHLSLPGQVVLADDFHVAGVALDVLGLLTNEVEVAILQTVGVAVDVGEVAACAALGLDGDVQRSTLGDVEGEVPRAELVVNVVGG